MDPHATLIDLLRAILEGDTDALRERADDLAAWIDKGGYRPDTRPAIRALFNLGGADT